MQALSPADTSLAFAGRRPRAHSRVETPALVIEYHSPRPAPENYHDFAS